MSAAKEFTIYAKTMTGLNFAIVTNGSETVEQLKDKVQAKVKAQLGAESPPVSRLVFQSKPLTEGDKTLTEVGIGEESIVYAVIPANKPTHYFFALDDSGSMSSYGRWQQLLKSFADFVAARQASAEKTGVPSKDRVSVFFHETHCRLALWRDAAGKQQPFDNVPLADVKPGSLVDNFSGGGNNFTFALDFIKPYLQRETECLPVLMFMTDGGDCGDGDSRYGDYRQRAYDTMAAIKAEIPELRLYVTVVFTDSTADVEGAKKLCIAGGSADLDTFFTHLVGAKRTSAPPSHSSYSSSRARRGYVHRDDDEDDCDDYEDDCDDGDDCGSFFAGDAGDDMSSHMAAQWETAYMWNTMDADF